MPPLYLRKALFLSRKPGPLQCEARKANRIANQALIASQRPWVGLDDENPLETTPLTIAADGTASLRYTVNAKNFGNYGANSVFAFAHLIVTQDLSDMPQLERQFCLEDISPRIGFVLFPSARTRATTMFPDSVPASRRITHAGSGSQFQAYLVGCVSYADQFGTPHHTVTEFRLGHAGTTSSVIFDAIPNSTVVGDWTCLVI